MYVPRHFDESRPEILRELVRVHPFATLVTWTGEEIEADHLPMELDPAPAPLGTLVGHVARANPVWKRADAAVEALAIFRGPQSYVSPGWYPTKHETGKVVPTWNYAVVHAWGRLRFVEDRVWLRALVERLTRRHEAGRPAPWAVDDAPADFIDAMLGAIVGVELVVTRFAGKWKLGQNRSPADRDGMLRGLAEESSPGATELAAAMRRAFDDATD
jgi:transcriptional regulator